MSIEQRLDAAWQDLPEADAPIAKEIYARHRDDIIQKLRASRTAAQKAARGLRAKTFDDAEVRADIDASNERYMEYRKAVQDMFLDVGSKISQAGRQRLRFGGAL
jgi:hypothetical protein